MAIAAKNIFLFYGPDNYTASKKILHWRDEFEKKYGDMNSHVFEGEKFTAAEFNEAVSTLPFLSDKKLIIVRDFLSEATEDERKRMTDIVEKIPEHCIVVFIEHETPDARTALYKKLCKIGQKVEFASLEKPDLIQWIKKRFNEKATAGKFAVSGTSATTATIAPFPSAIGNAAATLPTASIGAAEAEILADTVGPDLWQMDQEVEKLSLYGQNKPIDRKAIENLASINLSASIFKLTDYLATKNARMSLKTLDTLIASGEDLFQIFFMIVRHFRILIHVKACLEKKMDRQQIVKETGVHPFAVTNAVSQSKNFPFELLKRIHRSLLQIDIDAKSGGIKTTTGDNTELRLALEKLMVRTSQSQRSEG
jgi:DNA polymerase III subunit delta